MYILCYIHSPYLRNILASTGIFTVRATKRKIFKNSSIWPSKCWKCLHVCNLRVYRLKTLRERSSRYVARGRLTACVYVHCLGAGVTRGLRVRTAWCPMRVAWYVGAPLCSTENKSRIERILYAAYFCIWYIRVNLNIAAWTCAFPPLYGATVRQNSESISSRKSRNKRFEHRNL